MTADLTALLGNLRNGDNEALGKVYSALYNELRQLAHARLHGNDAPTLLDTTSLVHESYLRLLKAGQIDISNRAHFLAYAARVMRSIVVDFVRVRSAQRRGGKEIRVEFREDLEHPLASGEAEILKVNEALDSLAAVSERLVSVVEMRYFGGMNEAEIAEALGVAERTVRRDWEKAKLLLAAALK